MKLLLYIVIRMVRVHSRKRRHARDNYRRRRGVQRACLFRKRNQRCAVRTGEQDVRAPHHPTDTSQMSCPFVPFAM